jgi:parvulin-like peptidyl-prolyl isomerase
VPRVSVVLPISLFVVVLLSACGGSPAAAPAGQQAPAATEVPPVTLELTPEPTEALVAQVNGQGLTLAAFQNELRREEARLAEAGVMPADRAVFERTVLNSMIDQVLIEQAALVQGLQVSDEELEAEITFDIELAGGDEAWRAWLVQNDLSPEEYRRSIYSALLTAKIRDQVIAAVPEIAPQAHARHLLVSTQEEAQQLYDQLQGGADFGQLAFDHSRDVSTRELGGDLGWFTRELLTEPVVAEVAFTLEIGQVSEPISSRLGYHIVQTLERAEDRPLDELSRAMMFEMTFERWRQSLWDRAVIERFAGS